MKKVGIMGGTFNPIHLGHLFLAEYAYDSLGLDQMLFMPSNHPPHKAQLEVVSSNHRLNMVKLAIQDNPHFIASDIELKRTGLTFTADTLRMLTRENSDTEYYFLVGADSFMKLQSWREPEAICKLCTLVAAGREQQSIIDLENQVTHLREQFGAKVILLDMPMIDISSGQIRDRIAARKSIRYYMPEVVASYIEENGLYHMV